MIHSKIVTPREMLEIAKTGALGSGGRIVSAYLTHIAHDDKGMECHYTTSSDGTGRLFKIKWTGLMSRLAEQPLGTGVSLAFSEAGQEGLASFLAFDPPNAFHRFFASYEGSLEDVDWGQQINLIRARGVPRPLRKDDGSVPAGGHVRENPGVSGAAEGMRLPYRSIPYEIVRRADGAVALCADSNFLHFEPSELALEKSDGIIFGRDGMHQPLRLKMLPEDVVRAAVASRELVFFAVSPVGDFKSKKLAVSLRQGATCVSD